MTVLQWLIIQKVHHLSTTGGWWTFHRNKVPKGKGKICTLTWALIFTTFTVKAQWSSGLQAGMTINHLHTNIDNRSYTQYNTRTGWAVSIPLRYNFGNRLAVQVEGGFSQKNYSISRTGAFSGVYDRFNNTYLQLPIMMQGLVKYKKITGFISLGLYGAWWTTGRVKGAIPDIFNIIDSTAPGQQPGQYARLAWYQEQYHFDPVKDNRLEVGWLTSIGIHYPISNTYLLVAEARYYQSLTDQQKKYMTLQTPRYNQTFTFLAGCMFTL